MMILRQDQFLGFVNRQWPLMKFEKRYYSPIEIARYFAVSKRTIYRLINDFDLKAVKVRNALRIPAAEFKKFERKLKEIER